MKRAKRMSRPPLIKPRNPLATDPMLKKGGAHSRRDKRASRARHKQTWLKEAQGE